MKSKITITRWLEGRTWIESKEAERRSDERWHMALILGGSAVLLALLWGAAWVVLSG